MNCLNCKVTCVEPSVWSKGFVCKLRIFVVALHYSRTFNLKNTFVTTAKNKAILWVYNSCFYTAYRRTNCSEYRTGKRTNRNNRSSFCKTITFKNFNSNCPEEFINLRREGTTTTYTAAEVFTKHCLDFSEYNEVAQPVKREHQNPWNEE